MAALPSFVELLGSLGIHDERKPRRHSDARWSPEIDTRRGPSSPTITVTAPGSPPPKKQITPRSSRYSPYSSSRRYTLSVPDDNEVKDIRISRSSSSSPDSSRSLTLRHSSSTSSFTSNFRDRRPKNLAVQVPRDIPASAPISSLLRRRSPNNSPTSPTFRQRSPTTYHPQLSPMLLPTLPEALLRPNQSTDYDSDMYGGCGRSSNEMITNFGRMVV